MKQLVNMCSKNRAGVRATAGRTEDFARLYARENPLSLTLKNVRRRGIVGTFKAMFRVAVDIAFDLRYGTDTIRCAQMNMLDFESEHKECATLYQASEAQPLRGLMRKLDLPKDGSFVDLGAGKGRVLLIAAQFGFKRVIGVEFSRELCEIARENVRAFARKTQTAARIEIVEFDVANYPIESDSNVFFMFNPFDEVVLTQFLTNLRSSLTRFPRKIWLIYNNPIHDAAVHKSELFCACREYEVNQTRFKVYQNKP
jgi:SAM-dependent methyltransferase